ncbi:LmbU family transcriptional regulator [Streptomyces sp. NBC_00859]|uniref:LmbU family transcriptional regulator n=1 Tax=Streptomyces sp. NBC_00859 TaxID=2903682 RepID=UPI0038632A58|nr:LmbU family transcriptional regulator [Streptomyces sp. NBC_00859]
MNPSSFPSPSVGPGLPRTTGHGQPKSGAEGRRGDVLTTRVGLQMAPNLTFDAWQRAGGQLAGVIDSSSWWLGDWLVYGKDHYADRYQLGIRTAGLKYQTLRNYAWVSRRFDMHRRRDALTFQHHAEVASLPYEKQEMWLDDAEAKRWTTKQLRNAIKAINEGEPATAPRPETPRQIALPGHRIDRWHQAAEHSGIDFDRWVLVTLDSAAGQILEHTENITALSA